MRPIFVNKGDFRVSASYSKDVKSDPPSSVDVARVEYSGADAVIATFRSVVIVLWISRTTEDRVEDMRRVLEEHAKHHPTIALLQVVEEAWNALPADIRAKLSDVLSSGGERLGASAVVTTQTGFRAAAVRAIATGLVIAARPSFAHQVFQSVDQACAWLAAILSGSPAPGFARNLVRGVDGLKSKYKLWSLMPAGSVDKTTTIPPSHVKKRYESTRMPEVKLPDAKDRTRKK